jgi:hypothetical protein
MIFAAASLGTAAMAQTFVNGDFEGGNLNGWTITPTSNGQTLVQDVVPFDIDFGGSLGVSQVGRFQVGQVVFTSGVPAGIEVTQMINLAASTQYTISFNAAAYRETTTGNAQGGIFDLIVDGVSLANWAAGSTSSSTTNSSFLTANFMSGNQGMYSIGVRIQRPFTPAGSLFQVVDNFSIVVPEPGTFVALGLGVAGLLVARRRKA